MSRLKKLIGLAIFTLLLIGCAKGAVWQKTLDSSQTQNPTERIAVLKKIMRVEAPTKSVPILINLCRSLRHSYGLVKRY